MVTHETAEVDPRAEVIRTLVQWTRTNVSDEVYDRANESAIAILTGLGYGSPEDHDRLGVEIGDEVQSLLIVALARLQMPERIVTIHI